MKELTDHVVLSRTRISRLVDETDQARVGRRHQSANEGASRARAATHDRASRHSSVIPRPDAGIKIAMDLRSPGMGFFAPPISSPSRPVNLLVGGWYDEDRRDLRAVRSVGSQPGVPAADGAFPRMRDFPNVAVSTMGQGECVHHRRKRSAT
jgi:hypothetical protein